MLRTLVQLLLTPMPSCLKVPIYRLMGARIDSRAHIGALAVVSAKEIEMGPGAVIKPLTLIIGLKRLSLGPYTAISNLCVINGPASLVLAARAQIGAGCMIDLHADVTLGEFSGLGPGCMFMTHGVYWPVTWGCNCKVAPIEVEPFVWITFGVRVGPGVKVAGESLVLPGSTLSRNVKQSTILYDDGLHRETLPFYLVRRGMSRAELEGMIRELARGLATDESCPLGFTLVEETESVLTLRRKGKTVRIHLFEPVTPTDRDGAIHWRFGYDLEAALEVTNGVEALDFRQLWHSRHPSRLLRKVTHWMRYRYGVRFADIRDRGLFKVFPPPLTDETEEQSE